MTTPTSDELMAKGKEVRAASQKLAVLSTHIKNQVLSNIADALTKHQDAILLANAADYQDAKSEGLSDDMLDRLLLNPERLLSLGQDVVRVVSLPDPIGESFDTNTLPNGLVVGKRRVPLGVIGSIYESRPNVTIDIISLSLKSGNACMLRGGKEALRSNQALVGLAQRAMADAGVGQGAVQFVDDPDRSLVNELLSMKEYIDLMVPRGGPELIRFVGETASMPVITGGIGVCHAYMDSAADPDSALAIAYNAKVQRPTVCNALDTLMVHSQVASSLLPRIAAHWAEAGVEMRCDRRALSILAPLQLAKVRPVEEEDWGREFLALIAAVKVVDSLDEALEHIRCYGSGHSEAIVTEDNAAAMRFLEEVDASAVFVNASTRFNDGSELGLGAEVGISTQKFHARGPIGLKELTSYKWTITGTGHVRS
jgi:glutamate-5-semialdehyde dehydrogenase